MDRNRVKASKLGETEENEGEQELKMKTWSGSQKTGQLGSKCCDLNYFGLNDFDFVKGKIVIPLNA